MLTSFPNKAKVLKKTTKILVLIKSRTVGNTVFLFHLLLLLLLAWPGQILHYCYYYIVLRIEFAKKRRNSFLTLILRIMQVKARVIS